jgi:Low psii accumulation1 / Rep27
MVSLRLLCLLGILEIASAFLFSPSKIGQYNVSHRTRSVVTPSASFARPKTVIIGKPSLQRLYAEKDQTKKAGIDEKVRTKLLSESIAPWRSLRLFLYGSLGTGALIGGLITLSGTAAIVAGAKEGDMNTEVGSCPRFLCCYFVKKEH